MNDLDNAARLPDTDGREEFLNLDTKPSTPFPNLAIPDSLQANVDRHCANLLALVASLGRAGIDEATIETSVVEIVASYEYELIRTIKSLYRDMVDV